MAVPSLPSNLASGDIVTETWVDQVRELLAWFRDDRPLFSGQLWSNVGGNGISATGSTSTNFAFGTAGAFKYTPEWNRGGFTVASGDADPEDLVIPEDGYYQCTVTHGWQAASGDRGFQMRVNGASGGQMSLVSRISSYSTADLTNSSTDSYIHDFTAGDEVSFDVYNYAATQDCNFYCQFTWIADL